MKYFYKEQTESKQLLFKSLKFQTRYIVLENEFNNTYFLNSDFMLSSEKDIDYRDTLPTLISNFSWFGIDERIIHSCNHKTMSYLPSFKTSLILNPLKHIFNPLNQLFTYLYPYLYFRFQLQCEMFYQFQYTICINQ